MKSTCLVTGGSGFVGRRLIQILLSHGWQVRALARSESAVRAVRGHGAEPVRGSLDDVASLEVAARDCDVVFHVAAYFKLWGDPAEFERSNVQGTANLLRAAAGASVKRFVQLGAAAVVMGDRAPMLGVNEALPRQERAWAPYSSSKARSEAMVLGANRPGIFETVVVRPPMIWGPGMPTLDHLVEVVKAGQFRWVDGGSQAMSTAHVEDVPVTYWSPKGRMADVKRTLERTPKMLSLFSDKTGFPYPYAQYAQIFVQDFIFGGMENTSATTLTDTCIVDRDAEPEVWMDGLVAHELGHQWFGDLVTCRDWSQGWLNEGFATFMETVWKRASCGADEENYYRMGEGSRT